MSALSLSTSWNSSRHQDGFEMLKEIRELGFDYAELGHGIRYSLWPGILKAMEEKVVKLSSLHNFCPVPTGVLRPSPNCYEFTDPRPNLRKAAIKATLETVRQATKLGAPAVVLHLGSAGPNGLSDKLERWYREGKLFSRQYVAAKVRAVRQRRETFPIFRGRLRDCMDPVVALASQEGIKLGFEIREVFEEFPHEEEMEQLLASYPARTVGYWHDFGHAARKDFLGWHTHAETLARRRNRLIGCHIHDCRPPSHDHQPLGRGEIDFPSLVPYISPQTITVLELSPRCKRDQVIASKEKWNSYAGMRGLIIRGCISAAILGYLARKVHWPELGAIAVTMDPLWMFAAFACFAPMLGLTAWRWSILLRVQRIILPVRKAFELCLVSHFFNAFLFGVTGGDVVKIYYATKAAPGTKTAAGLSVVVDRLIGLVVLLIFAVILCLWQYNFLNANAETRAAVWSVLAIAACAAGLGIVSLFLPALKEWAVRRGWWQRMPLRELLEKLLEAYTRYHTAWRANTSALALSFFNHSFNFVMSYCVARAMHLDVPFWPFLSILPIINLLIALPVSISGLGVREGLSVLFFSLMGYDKEHAMTFSLSLFFLMLVWSLIGGLCYLRYEPVPADLVEEAVA